MADTLRESQMDTCSSSASDTTKEIILRPINAKVIQILEEQRKTARAEADDLQRTLTRLIAEFAESDRKHIAQLQEKKNRICTLQTDVDLLRNLQHEQEHQTKMQIASILQRHSGHQSLTSSWNIDDMLNVSELLRRLDVVLEAASSANIIDSHRNDKHSGKCIEMEYKVAATQTVEMLVSKEETPKSLLHGADSWRAQIGESNLEKHVPDRKHQELGLNAGSTRSDLEQSRPRDEMGKLETQQVGLEVDVPQLDDEKSTQNGPSNQYDIYPIARRDDTIKSIALFTKCDTRQKTKNTQMEDLHDAALRTSHLRCKSRSTVLTISTPRHQSYHLGADATIPPKCNRKCGAMKVNGVDVQLSENANSQQYGGFEALHKEYDALKDMLISMLLPTHRFRRNSKEFQRKMWKEESADYLLSEWMAYCKRRRLNLLDSNKSLKLELKMNRKQSQKKEGQIRKLREQCRMMQQWRESHKLEIDTLRQHIQSQVAKMKAMRRSSTHKNDVLQSDNALLQNEIETKNVLIAELRSFVEQNQSLSIKVEGNLAENCEQTTDSADQSTDYNKLKGLVNKFNAEINRCCK